MRKNHRSRSFALTPQLINGRRRVANTVTAALNGKLRHGAGISAASWLKVGAHISAQEINKLFNCSEGLEKINWAFDRSGRENTNKTRSFSNIQDPLGQDPGKMANAACGM